MNNAILAGKHVGKGDFGVAVCSNCNSPEAVVRFFRKLDVIVCDCTKCGQHVIVMRPDPSTKAEDLVGLLDDMPTSGGPQ